MRNFRDYDFWQDSKKLAVDVCIELKNFPKLEWFALCQQLRRSIVSIPSNIAEGCGRDSEADFTHFLDVALGSAYESETQIEIAYELKYLTRQKRDNYILRLQSIERRITAFVRVIKKAQTQPKKSLPASWT